jgi:hypothetical protein
MYSAPLARLLLEERLREQTGRGTRDASVLSVYFRVFRG